jgi:hypothetical protein
MPYIKQSYRKTLDKVMKPLLKELTITWTPGELNYVFSMICRTLLAQKLSYQTLNALIGVLENVKLELYSRQGREYEDRKIIENGDLNIKVEELSVSYDI